MIVYAAAVELNYSLQSSAFRRATRREQKIRVGVPHILESYHYVKKQSWVDKMRKDKVKIFLDSGAFSAYSQGIEVSIQEYIQYIKDNSDILLHLQDNQPVASVLDAIGNPEETWENQRKMEQGGVTPLPCFHYGEDPKFLQWYIKNYSYITIGGMVAVSNKVLLPWLDYIWGNYLTNTDGSPKLKVHGFGMTSQYIMERYPWYSVDSSSWVQCSGNGAIMLPNGRTLAVSNNSPMRKRKNQHYNTLSKSERKEVLRMVEELGFEMDRLQTNYISRWTFNLHAYTLMNKKYENKKNKFILQQPTLF